MRNAALFIASQSGNTEAGLLHSVLQAFRGAHRNWTNRRKIASLVEFDDHMLADIGLTRRDVREALELPFSSDPGRELQFRASRTRGWNA